MKAICRWHRFVGLQEATGRWCCANWQNYFTTKRNARENGRTQKEEVSPSTLSPPPSLSLHLPPPLSLTRISHHSFAPSILSFISLSPSFTLPHLSDHTLVYHRPNIHATIWIFKINIKNSGWTIGRLCYHLMGDSNPPTYHHPKMLIDPGQLDILVPPQTLQKSHTFAGMMNSLHQVPPTIPWSHFRLLYLHLIMTHSI